MTLNVRFILKCGITDGTLDVGLRTLWRSDSTIRTGVARGAEGEWAVGSSPSLCGQLTRCFSAVAELLLYIYDSDSIFDRAGAVENSPKIHLLT